jgi:hypothetical protein
MHGSAEQSVELDVLSTLERFWKTLDDSSISNRLFHNRWWWDSFELYPFSHRDTVPRWQNSICIREWNRELASSLVLVVVLVLVLDSLSLDLNTKKAEDDDEDENEHERHVHWAARLSLPLSTPTCLAWYSFQRGLFQPQKHRAH